VELFQSSKKQHEDQHDSSVEKLLKERSSVAASLKSINDVIRLVLSVAHRFPYMLLYCQVFSISQLIFI
jgi:hypothetical protein